MGSSNQNKSFLYRKTKHDHKNRSERSNASIVARKRLSQPLDTSETESSKVETDSLPECDLVDYHWKGSRKPLILNSFVMVWKNLLDRDFVTWDERTEQSICKDVWILVSFWFLARKSSRKGGNKTYRNIYQTKNSRYYFICLLMKPYQDSLDDSEDRSVDWKYTGRFLQFGELTYKLPSTGKPSVGERSDDKR